ncbi:hypothetical protein [Polaribacter staleyi]|uniref:hypothetical protein n=1 Tax=Polaribacter staleyi TaxID=2022337 RepID=UPI0031B9EB7A
MTGYITLLLLGLFVTLLHIVFIYKRYVIKLIPSLWSGETEWNPKIDRLKLLISCILLISPIFLINQLIKLNHHDDYFNYTSLIIINLLMIFSFWFNAKKITKLKENNSLSKFVYPDKEIKADLENLKLTDNKLKDISTNTINKVDHDNRKTNEKLNQFKIKQIELEKTSTDTIGKLNNNSSKNNLLEKKLESLKLTSNKLERKTININSKIDNSNQEIINLKKTVIKTSQNIIEVTKETKKNKSDFNKGLNEVKEKINQNKADSNKNFKETNNEISKIKDKAKPKERDTLKRRENINRIESEFNILISDLNKFPNYDSKQKVLSYKKDKLTALQTYQILLLFFQNKYNFNTKNTNEIIYSLFNKYFGNLTDIKKDDITIMNKGNWKEYKLRKHLTDVENEELYSQLNLYIKK